MAKKHSNGPDYSLNDIYCHVDPEDVRKSYMAHISQLGV